MSTPLNDEPKLTANYTGEATTVASNIPIQDVPKKEHVEPLQEWPVPKKQLEEVIVPKEEEEFFVDEPLEVPPEPPKAEVTPEGIKAIKPIQRVISDYPINASEKVEFGEEIILPSGLESDVRELLVDLPNINLLDNQQSVEWSEVLSEGLGYVTFKDIYVKSLENPNALFRNKIDHNGLNLTAKAPSFKPTENANLKGERVVIRILSHLGMGSLFQIPLWHSGFWVTFKPPGEDEIVEVHRMMMRDKIELGRYTYGLIFSQISSYTVNRLLDFAIANVYNTTVNADDINIGNLKEHIAIQDLYPFLWGFICTMYPKGFRYSRACFADAVKCNHIVSDTLNLTKLQYTNTLALTDWQRTFMSSRQDKTKRLDEVKRYKEELTTIQNKKIELIDGISVVIRSPSLKEYVDSGYEWIEGIVKLVDEVVSTDTKNEERNQLIVRYGQVSAMRQYSHWIESIEYLTNTIDDRDTINNSLKALSSNDVIRETYLRKIVEFINSSTISVIGIPVYDCPVCKNPQEVTKEGEYSNLIPLDVVQLFFDLLTQRVERLKKR